MYAYGRGQQQATRSCEMGARGEPHTISAKLQRDSHSKNLEGPNADPSEVIHSFFWPCSLAITRYSLWPGIIGAKKLDRSEHPFLVKYSVTKFRGSIQG
jgi:hypothetical protein